MTPEPFDYDEVETKASVRIYTYRKEVRHKFAKIRSEIGTAEHTVNLRVRADEDERHATFQFRETDSDENMLRYFVVATRELPRGQTVVTHHDICFTKPGFLIVTGMQYRDTLIRCISRVLHPNIMAFKPRQFTKSQTQDLTRSVLENTANQLARPRFHSFIGYKNRKFNDYMTAETRCATGDREYPKMMDDCDYFEPVFRVGMGDIDPPSELKVNKDGYIHSSRRLPFDDWLDFLRSHLPWCIGTV